MKTKIMILESQPVEKTKKLFLDIVFYVGSFAIIIGTFIGILF